jgi:hypothetical protein
LGKNLPTVSIRTHFLDGSFFGKKLKSVQIWKRHPILDRGFGDLERVAEELKFRPESDTGGIRWKPRRRFCSSRKLENSMNYLLIEPKVKAIAPNIALMKWARWCELKKYNYEYVRGKVVPDITPDKMLMSCIFSFDSKKYEETINFYKKLFPEVPVVVGGAFPSLNPGWFQSRWTKTLKNGQADVSVFRGINHEIENLAPKFDVEIKYEGTFPYDRDKIVLYASRGCVNKCGYCAVPRLEGDMKSYKSIKHILDVGKIEMPDAKSIVLYDNNFTEHEHFDNIVDELVDFGLPIDIHGLHVDSFTEHHAKRLSELNWASQGKNGTPYIRFSFDKLEYVTNIEKAVKLVVKYNIKANFFCYMLFNFTDSPHDFWRRIVEIHNIVNKTKRTITLFPQRYEPLNALKRNQYIGPKWTEEKVQGLVKLYTHLRGFIPISSNHNSIMWLGFSEEQFFEKVREMNKNKKLQKFEGDVIFLLEY